MVFKNKALNKFWRFSCSFQLGIPILVVIAVLTAWGTFVEAQFNDATAAKRLVFDSWMMWLAMSLLVYNLTAVVVDRWPWKKNHYPFITVHAGLIILVLGGYVTSEFGLDGSVSVNISGQNNFVSVANTDLVVYATFDGDRYSKIVDREVDFFSNSPTEKNPYVLQFDQDKIEIIDFARYAILDTKVKASDEPLSGASVRFQLTNVNAKQVQQITQAKKAKEAVYNFGPAQVILGEVPEKIESANQVYLTPVDSEKLKYSIYHKDKAQVFKKGEIKIGEVVQTGWMGFELRILDYLPNATETYDIQKINSATPLTVSAVQIRHKNKTRWLALNDVVKLFGDNKAYLLSFQNRRLDLGFQIHLNQFDVIRYQGTNRAKEYASQVSILKMDEKPENVDLSQNKTQISMNEPMKYSGYTIYQASFQEDEMGKPIASVFSVNKDPGRPIKYLGSLVLSLGIVWLFYQRRKKATSL